LRGGLPFQTKNQGGNEKLNEKKAWKRKDLNIPSALQERFDRVWPRHNNNWTDAVLESMKLYLDKYETKEDQKE
jgi:hypothetical protein